MKMNERNRESPSGDSLSCSSGEGGIRTLDDPEAIPVFETGAFNRSATSPARASCRPPGRLIPQTHKDIETSRKAQTDGWEPPPVAALGVLWGSLTGNRWCLSQPAPSFTKPSPLMSLGRFGSSPMTMMSLAPSRRRRWPWNQRRCFSFSVGNRHFQLGRELVKVSGST